MEISKSEYMMFLKHPAWVWLKKHDKSKLPPVDTSTQALFDQGNLFEEYVEELYKDSVKIGFSNYNEYKGMPDKSVMALKSEKTLLQPRFLNNGLTCIVDVLEYTKDGYNLIEIKSSTKVKQDHIYDLAFQLYVLKSLNININKISVIFVNNDYIRDGALSISKLIAEEDVTDQVMLELPKVEKNVEELRKVLEGPIPDISPVNASSFGYRQWMDVYTKLEPIEEDGILNLAGINIEQLKYLNSIHVDKLKDIPLSDELQARQKAQLEAVKQDSVIIDYNKISDFLNQFKFPLYFFDYETFAGVIPQFTGIKPYEQVPFQYSLHKLDIDSPNEVKHFEYLHKENTNSVKELAEQLIKDIGKEGTVLVWFEGFEKKCNELIGRIEPDYADAMQKINDRIIDLMVPFSTHMYIDKDFKGSASIKNVLPVLAPDQNYEDLDINNGQAAQQLWMNAVFNNKYSDKEKEKIFSDLIAYCKLDTFAMVKIFEKLISLN